MHISITPIPVKAVAGAWSVLEPLLAPAVAFDANVTLEDVRQKLLSGQCEAAYVAADGAKGVIVSEICTLDGVKCCWASYVAGIVIASPKRWISTMRALMAHFENLARSIGCQEMRIGGRDWSRILPDYVPCDGGPNFMRKVL